MDAFSLIPSVSDGSQSRLKRPLSRLDELGFLRAREERRKRDGYACQGCGIRLPKRDGRIAGIEVHHRNGNPRDNREENLISLCPLCHALFHIGLFARRFGKSMRLIHCPELDQGDLTLLSWTSAILFKNAERNPSEAGERLAGKAGRLRGMLLARCRFPETYFQAPEDTALLNSLIMEEDSLAFFGSVLGRLKRRHRRVYVHRGEWLGGLRIYFDPKDRELFRDRGGADLLTVCLEEAEWQAGKNWGESWEAIGRQFAGQLV
ncbi:MAG: hypothetical protein K5657_06590 [Desulfovibrio sp.]|nr:hypothetical protein [Desulfovibrio sp.]